MIAPDDLLIGVVAHISRAATLPGLVKRAEADFLNVDNGPGQQGESGNAAAAANHLAVLGQLNRRVVDHKWCIVLEDDAEPVPDFRTHAAAALSYAPSPLVGFYINRAWTDYNEAQLRLARRTRTSWLVANHLFSALAYAIRTDVLSDVVDYFAKCDTASTIETRLTMWATTKRQALYDEPRFYYTLPSMVDHSWGDSIIDPHVNKQIRRAWWIGTASNWDTPVIEFDPIHRGND